uniref:Uncharacterized protein n=1 Tax=Eutreptiella gymnastica TaxID=73025 RepID=A0A7S4D147_9EUGL
MGLAATCIRCAKGIIQVMSLTCTRSVVHLPQPRDAAESLSQSLQLCCTPDRHQKYTTSHIITITSSQSCMSLSTSASSKMQCSRVRSTPQSPTRPVHKRGKYNSGQSPRRHRSRDIPRSTCRTKYTRGKPVHNIGHPVLSVGQITALAKAEGGGLPRHNNALHLSLRTTNAMQSGPVPLPFVQATAGAHKLPILPDI